jgi:hypothetical protein
MPSVCDRVKQVLRLLPAERLISALLSPFFHNIPVQLEFTIALRLCVSCRLQLRHFEQLSQVVCVRALKQASVGKVVSLRQLRNAGLQPAFHYITRQVVATLVPVIAKQNLRLLEPYPCQLLEVVSVHRTPMIPLLLQRRNRLHIALGPCDKGVTRRGRRFGQPHTRRARALHDPFNEPHGRQCLWESGSFGLLATDHPSPEQVRCVNRKLLTCQENSSYRIDYTGILPGAMRRARIPLIPLVGAGRFELPTPAPKADWCLLRTCPVFN